MTTISHAVEKIINSRPLLQEAMMEEIASFGAIAERIIGDVEKDVGKKVKLSAVVMALRRYSEGLSRIKLRKDIQLKSEIMMKTNLCDIGIVKSPSFFRNLGKIYSLVDIVKGDTLNVIHGNYEISIITNEKYLARIKDILKDENIIRTERGLVLIGLNLAKEYVSQPGVLSFVTRKLTWNGVNIIEIISTYKELNFVVSKKDAVKAYNALEEL